MLGAARRGFPYALDERYCLHERYRTRPRAIHVPTNGPRAFVVIWMRGQAAREVDTTAIEELTARRQGNQHRRVAVLGDTDCSAVTRSFGQGSAPHLMAAAGGKYRSP